MQDKHASYESLVRQHAGDLYRFAYRLCGCRERAQDLVQEAFTEAWRSLPSLQDATRARAWLLQILRHRHWHGLRRAARRPSEQPLEDSISSSPMAAFDGALERSLDRDLIQRCLNRIEPIFREPFLLAFLQGYHCHEIATLLNVPQGTVLSRIYRARQKLRTLLAQELSVAETRCEKVRPLRGRAVL